MNGVYAGSFDPVTHGHVWVISKAAEVVGPNGQLIIALAKNADKKSYFTFEERVELIEDHQRGLPHPLTGGLHHLDRLLAVHAGGPGRDVRNRVPGGVHAVRGTDHQRDGLGFDLADAAMLPRLLVVGIVHHNMRELVREGLDLRGRVHVLPHRDGARP